MRDDAEEAASKDSGSMARSRAIGWSTAFPLCNGRRLRKRAESKESALSFAKEGAVCADAFWGIVPSGSLLFARVALRTYFQTRDDMCVQKCPVGAASST